MESLGKTAVGLGIRRGGGAWAVAVVAGALGVLAGACGSSGSHADGGAKKTDAREGGADATDTRADATPDAICGSDATTKRAVAQACGCDGDCVSGHCVDGVCC